MRAAETATARLSYLQPEAPPATARERVADTVRLSVHFDLWALRDTWIAFEETADCTAFQTFEWLSAYQLHIGTPQNEMPCIVTLHYADGSIACLLPLAIRRTGFVRELVFLGSELSDYNAPLLAYNFVERIGTEGFGRIWRNMLVELQDNPRSRYDIVRFEKMPARVRAQENPLVAFMTTTLNPSGSWATPLADTWDAFYRAKRSSSTRSRDRTKRKRLAEYGDIAFHTLQDTTDVKQALDVLMAQKELAFAERGIPNIFHKAGFAEFYRSIATDSRFCRIAHVSKLDVGSETAAVALGLACRGRYYYVLSSYTDNQIAKLGPGVIHLHELMRYAIERGMTVFDFTIGDERYKRDWCDSVQLLHDHLSPANARGAIAGALLRTRQCAKRAIKQSPVLWTMFTKARALRARGKSSDVV